MKISACVYVWVIIRAVLLGLLKVFEIVLRAKREGTIICQFAAGNFFSDDTWKTRNDVKGIARSFWSCKKLLWNWNHCYITF